MTNENDTIDGLIPGGLLQFAKPSKPGDSIQSPTIEVAGKVLIMLGAIVKIDRAQRAGEYTPHDAEKIRVKLLSCVRVLVEGYNDPEIAEGMRNKGVVI